MRESNEKKTLEDELLTKLEETSAFGMGSLFKERESLGSNDIKETEVSKEGEVEKEPSLFESEMKLLDINKNDILSMIDSVVSKGYVMEEGKIYGGRGSYSFKSVSITDHTKFIMFFERLEAKVQTTVDFYYNLYTVASFLKSYNGELLSESLEERVSFVQEKIPTPIFDLLTKKSFAFGRKVGILSTKEVADFF